MATQIQLRRGTAAQWTAANPVLANGEPGLETDTGKWKFGNGSSNWAALSYVVSPGMPAGGSTGQVLTKNSATDYDTDWATPTGGGSGAGTQLDYAQITANTPSITSATLTAAITGSLVTYDGSRVKLEFWASKVTIGGTGATARISFTRDGATNGIEEVLGIAASYTTLAFYIVCFDTPTAGAHTYGVSYRADGANSSLIFAGPGGAGQTPPAFLRVTKA
jgi:hypothetical protein